MKMKHSRISLLCLLASFVSCAGAMTADSPHNPYQAIIDRNVFGLKTPPPPPKPVNPEDNKPPPKIRLTGIMTGFPPGNKRALMMESVPPKPGSPANEVSLMLTEGQSEGDVEVVEIDEKEGKVKISQNGNVSTLDLPKPPNSPAAAPATAGLPTPAGFAPPPAPAAAPANPFNAGGMKTIPTRPLRPAGGGNGASTGFGAPAVNTTAGTGLNFGMPNAQQVQPNQQPQQADSPEVSALLIEANREQMKASGDPMYKLLPPTPLNPKANTVEDPELQAAGGNPGVPTLPTLPVRRR